MAEIIKPKNAAATIPIAEVIAGLENVSIIDFEASICSSVIFRFFPSNNLFFHQKVHELRLNKIYENQIINDPIKALMIEIPTPIFTD